MRKNYLVSFLGIMLCLSVYSQSEEKGAGEELSDLSRAAYQDLKNYDYNESIQKSLRVIEDPSRKENFYELYHAYNVLGITYENLKDTVRAQSNYEKALDNALKSNNDTIQWWAYNNLGNILSANPHTIKRGLSHYNKAISLVTAIGDSISLFTPVINIGWTYLENKNYEEALPYLEKAALLSKKDTAKTGQSQLYTLYGMYHSGMDDFHEARCYFDKAILVAEKDSLLVEASFAYSEFSKMLLKSGKAEEAYAALKKHQSLETDLLEKEKSHQREAVYARFETQEYKKNLEAAQIEQQYKDEVIAKNRELSFIMFASLIIMLIFLVLLFRNNQSRKKLIEQLKEKNNELQEAKDEAERLSLLKTRFFSTVSHELRTPLYGVVGLTSLLLEDNKDKEKEEDLKSLKFSADYLLALINDVLQMNKMESNLVHLENGPFSVEDLLKDIIKSFEFSRKQNQNIIDLQIDPNLPDRFIGDSMRLSQILMNLVGNSVKFTERGRVWVKAELVRTVGEKCLIHFEVGDTGIGIPENKQKLIFEEFSQLRSNNYNYQGTGLGLPIVKKLLTLFNSEVHLESEEGKGSVFSFDIMFDKDPAAEVIPEIPVSEAKIADKLIRKVLIVDDNRINQVVTQRILEKRDFECRIAGSGEEAIEILKVENIDLVLMDVNMPGMNGMQTTREIRKFNPNVPVIALTAVEIEEMREEILSAGMNDIIVKPYDIPQFFNTIFRNILAPAV